MVIPLCDKRKPEGMQPEGWHATVMCRCNKRLPSTQPHEVTMVVTTACVPDAFAG
jgi:hypothetical protein